MRLTRLDIIVIILTFSLLGSILYFYTYPKLYKHAYRRGWEDAEVHCIHPPPFTFKFRPQEKKEEKKKSGKWI